MARIVLILEYDGSVFYGWQRQRDLPSVQAALETALAQIAAHPVTVFCAGRTDTGVHASAQVIHFDTTVARPLNAWVRGVNNLLPAAVVVRAAVEVPESFHARYSAYRRYYRYLLLNRPQRPGLWAGRAGWFYQPLRLAPMQAAVASLIGRHDFSAFRAAECQAKTPIKEMVRAEVCQQGDFFIFDFEANAFLHHMIRNLVGALLYVGKGAWSPEKFREVLDTQDRCHAAPTFSPAGLYFQGARYDAAFGLPTFSEAFDFANGC
ncbi:MAG: tRNA pseudouridine(38-40) synthase TruA [Zoogloeaceae bacterium]|nr:tRNA pseudouridine(38-40) synthase TruA [Zoogloeaceae bacterium]